MTDILVFAKQIPNVNRIEFDPVTMRIKRENVELNLNSFDRKAIEEALRIREKKGGRVSVATMGPPSAADILKEALRMGVDHCYLITDRAYAGADTLVTSRILAKFASTVHTDLILMGKYSLDGETSQVPPEVAQLLGIRLRTSVSRIDIGDDGIVVEVESEEGLAEYREMLPALFSVSEKINKPRAPLKEEMDFEQKITRLDEKSLAAGVTGADSPTQVMDTVRVESGRNVEFLELNEETFGRIDSILYSRSENEPQRTIEPYEGESRGEIWGVALGDGDTSVEIASKISQLSRDGKLRASMFGNIKSSELKGMPCHEYIFIDCRDMKLFAGVLTDLIRERGPEIVVFPSTVEGREVSARIAATLGLGLTADCVDLEITEGRLIQHKPAFGGGVVARIVSRTKPQMATVRPGIFRKYASGRSFLESRIDVAGLNQSLPLTWRKRPESFGKMAGARVVVGLGRGIKDGIRMGEVMDLARMLGAAVGGTRPVVDAGLLPRQQQIGLTGYSISPDVYFALGISGRDNHVVGIRYAKKVVAVNNSRDAPIFRYADYGIVSDMFDFISRYRMHLSEARSR